MIKKVLSAFIVFTLFFSVILVRKNPETVVSSMSFESIQLPILMYHGITSKYSQVNDYFIMDTTFEKDLKYLKEHGYNTVTPRDLIDYVDGKGKMPENPIMITFDDGYLNNYTYAYPLLKKHHMTALISIIGSPSETASTAEYLAKDYCNMTWPQITEIANSKVIEIGNHTWDLHKAVGARRGASSNYGEDEKQYQRTLKKDLSKLQDNIKKLTGAAPVAFAWPYGFTSAPAKAVFDALGIRVTLTSYDGVSTIKKGEPNSLFDLKRLLRTPKVSLEKLLEAN